MTMLDTPSFEEDHISQIPALEVLIRLGYQYLSPQEALVGRGNRQRGVLLEGILESQLRKLNRIRFKGQDYPFTEGNIHAAVQAIKDVVNDGLVRTNEKIYDLICLGKSLPQSIDGDTKSFPIRYIDWDNWKNNVFHVTEEFSVERNGGVDSLRPDIVLFVNGIPFVVIECKRPDSKDPIGKAIEQQIRNQQEFGIPGLFLYAQLLIAISMNEAKYATVGTPLKFWATWKEQEDIEPKVLNLLRSRQPIARVEKVFSERFAYVREYFGALQEMGREVTEQDRTLYALCRPERLLEIVFRFVIFDAGERKIARYQQYFCVNKIMNRLRESDADGGRKGGVVWHTQGSGKSLTMVMLAEAIALAGYENFKIVLVTDRVDLDDQIYKTFAHCGTEPEQAKTGRDLAKLISSHRQRIITTVIDKFEAAVSRSGVKNDSPNIFVLVDESHRSQYGELHAKMRKALPNACFIGFTGTPLTKQDRNTLSRFGGLIDTYTIAQAVKDKAVVPLLYEGRHVDQNVDQEPIDTWFERVTEPLSSKQKADLKRKFATTDQLNKAQQRVMRIAWDICVHYRDNWQGTPYKAQLVAQDRATALLYKKFLDEFGMVSSEVMISAPDDREGEEDPTGEPSSELRLFWKKMMARYGSEKEYIRQVINAFKNGDQPEIIIVVDKLLTGFDAPRNTVLYLTRSMNGHTLLQAIARVNRLCDGKDFGYIIDYRGLLENLDKALDVYGKLSEFDPAGLDDLSQTMRDVNAEARKLPQLHSSLWDVFKTVKNRRDAEAYERLLSDEPLRTKFYDRLLAFSNALGIALGSVKFVEETPAEQLAKYKEDLRFFMKLRVSVRRRYAEVVDFRDYETKIQKLVDTHVGTGEVERVTALVNIFDADAFAKEVAKLEGNASRADTIAYRTTKTIEDRMQEDPAYYRRFSEMLEDAIRAFREQRLSDAEYLKQVTEIAEKVRKRTGDGLPPTLEHHEVAKAFYGVLLENFGEHAGQAQDLKEIGAEAGLRIDEIVRENRIVYWVKNADVQNRMKSAIEDYLFDLKEKRGLALRYEDIDRILESCLEIARRRYAQ